MFWVDWQLTLIALIPFPIIIIATYYFKESINQSFFKVRNAVAISMHLCRNILPVWRLYRLLLRKKENLINLKRSIRNTAMPISSHFCLFCFLSRGGNCSGIIHRLDCLVDSQRSIASAAKPAGNIDVIYSLF